MGKKTGTVLLFLGAFLLVIAAMSKFYMYDRLAVVPALAQAGFVTIAIDLPLHGVSADTANPTNPMNLLYKNQAFSGTPAAALVTGERTFDVDFINNSTGAAGPDGTAVKLALVLERVGMLVQISSREAFS